MALDPTSKSHDAAGGRDTKSMRTRARILDAAARVMSVKGYSGTRLTDVANYAELQAPAIYYYFASREDLIEEVMWKGIADMRQHVQSVLGGLDSSVTPMDRILAAVDAHLRHELGVSDYATASIRNSGQIPDHLRQRQIAEEAKYTAVWRKLIKDAASENQVRADLDLLMARMLILGALNWAAEWWTPRRGSLDTVVLTAQSIVRHGLAPAQIPVTNSGKTNSTTRPKGGRAKPATAI
jgi:AcrR family transcriptional regulator